MARPTAQTGARRPGSARTLCARDGSDVPARGAACRKGYSLFRATPLHALEPFQSGPAANFFADCPAPRRHDLSRSPEPVRIGAETLARRRRAGEAVAARFIQEPGACADRSRTPRLPPFGPPRVRGFVIHARLRR